MGIIDGKVFALCTPVGIIHHSVSAKVIQT